MDIAKIVNGLIRMAPGMSTTVRQLFYTTGTNEKKNGGQAANSAPNPGTHAIRIDEESIRYLLSHHYQRPASFVVFSSDARQKAPGLYESIMALRNRHNNGDGLLMQLVGDRFSAMAECILDGVGYELKVTGVAEQRSGSIYSGISTPPSS